MSVPYDVFSGAFLNKVTEYDFIDMSSLSRTGLIDWYMKIALSEFRKICKYDFSTTSDDESRIFDIDVDDGDIYEIVDIVSDGMVVQWMRPFVYRQENLENILNTRDFSTYSPAELLMRIGNAYSKAQRDFVNKMREYSYAHGDLTRLHL